MSELCEHNRVQRYDDGRRPTCRLCGRPWAETQRELVERVKGEWDRRERRSGIDRRFVREASLDRLFCGWCGDDLALDEIVGHLASEGREIPAKRDPTHPLPSEPDFAALREALAEAFETHPDEVVDETSALVAALAARGFVLRAALPGEALRTALAEWHGGQLGRFGHRAGDHFDECVFCAMLHGSGFAYPVLSATT